MNHEIRTLIAQAEAAIDRGDWVVARDRLQALIALQPNAPQLWLQLSYVESYLGHYRLAREAATRAAGLPPISVEVAGDVLARLRTFNLVEAMRAYLPRLGPASAWPLPLRISTAMQFSSLNLHRDALAMLSAAAPDAARNPGWLLARAQVLMYLGKLDDALQEAGAGLAIAPDNAQGWWLLSRMKKWSRQDNHVAAIRAQLSTGRRSPLDTSRLGYALHKELDDLGDIEGAWQALETACRARRGALQERDVSASDVFEALEGFNAPAHPEAHGEATALPVFVIGMHRSGTTLLEQMLDGHPEVQGIGEVYDFTSAMRHATDHHCAGVIDATLIERASAPGFDFAEAGRHYLRGMAWRLDGHRVFTDKLPSNFLNAGFICRALPQAKLLHMVRDPVEVCFSNLRELFASANPHSYDLIELADYYLRYQRLMKHWHSEFPGRILDIDYARLVREPERVMREVAAFCGIDYTPEMLAIGNRTRGVSTASAVQVREGIQVRDVPKWKPYESKLQPLIDHLRAGGAFVD